MTQPEAVRARVLSLVRRHGFNATAFQTLDDGYHYAFVDDDACVAYVDTGAAWVVAGAPIAPTEQLARIASEFVRLARRARKRCCFFATEARFVAAAGASMGALRLGEQPVWDPRRWTEVVAGHKSLREQLRRARAKGVVVRAVSVAELEESEMREAIAALGARWFATRQMAPMGFLVKLRPFSFTEHRRCFVAEREGRVVGYAGLVPVPARGGWFVEHVLRDPRAPNGTGELMVDAVMRWAAAEGCDWLTLGLAPLAGDVPRGLRAARRSSSLLYDFEGIRAYKAKLRPDRWAPLYLSYPAGQSTAASLFDVLAAFTSGGFVRFALRSLLRGSTAVLCMLTLLLVPWTMLLALAPAARWFGVGWVKWSWVAFDVALLVALFLALKKPTLRLLTALAVAVSADALLTGLQALVWNLPHASAAIDWVVIAAACSAPSLAAVVLWGARARHRVAMAPASGG